MNQQRKVIYARRDQILEGADLRDTAMDELAEAVDATVETYCVADASDEWDVEGLLAELGGYWPTKLTVDQVEQCGSNHEIEELALAEAIEHYERREAELTPTVMREVERQVMLRIIDQRWREHLEEMDYLKEGINLRAMGQKDPLTEWQREGFEMFGSMMKGIAQDFVRYVMHVQVVQEQAPAPAAQPLVTEESGPAEPGSEPSGIETTPAPAPAAAPAAAAPATPRVGRQSAPAVQNMRTSSSDDVAGSGFQRAVASADGEPAEILRSSGSSTIEQQAGTARQGTRSAKQETVVKDEWSKTPRNAPCPCGSGKKFKMCHGAN
jgi:preprotein translocase subunit SecA